LGNRRSNTTAIRRVDLELKPVFGVDVFAKPFPVSRGYEIYAGTNSRVLLVRLEDLDRAARTAFAEFLGVDVANMVQRNEASDKVYADVYRRFKELLKMPRPYLDRMYSSRYSRHFYTPAELAEFPAGMDARFDVPVVSGMHVRGTRRSESKASAARPQVVGRCRRMWQH
jgi:hypothetical protein